MKEIISFIRINDGKFRKGFLILSFVIFVAFVILNGVEVVDSIYERIMSVRLFGDENAFLQNNKISSLKPISLGFPSIVIDYFLNDVRISTRITAFFYTLLTCAYLLNQAYRIYIFSLLTFCFIFLHNYPILYSATDDSALMFFLVLGFHQLLIKDNQFIGLAALFIALITKDISIIYGIAFIISVFLVKRRLFFPIRRSLIFLGVAILIAYLGGYNLFWKDKVSHQAANYAQGVSWFNVRSVSTIAKYNNELKAHRVFPEEYFRVVKKLNINVPNNQLDFLKCYPKEWIYDKLIKFKSVIIPHRVFGLSIIVILLMLFLQIISQKSINNVAFTLNFFLLVALVGMILVVVGFFERRWIFGLEILFILQFTTSLMQSEQTKNFLNTHSIFYVIMYFLQIYMNRDIFI